MKKATSLPSLFYTGLLITLLAVGIPLNALWAGQNDLEDGFRSPPASARPFTWWQWMNQNITKEGITADLEAMAAIGLRGAHIFNTSCGIPEGPVKYLSPEWLGLLKHAASEAKRLQLELGLQNCAGWATTGGPWVTPENGMQRLYWSETDVDGGKALTLQLPTPEVRSDKRDLSALQPYYRDIAVLAYPTVQDKKRMYRSHTKTLRGTARAGLMPDIDGKGPAFSRRNRIPKEAIVPRDRIVDISKHMDEKGQLNWKAPEGKWTILRLGYGPTGHKNKPAPEAGTGWEIDKMSRKAVDVHWKHGIQPILNHLGPLSGSVLKTLVVDSYEAGNHSWTPKLREEFKKRRGYEMGAYLVALSGRCVDSIETTERFYHDFRRTIGDLVTENYYGYMAELSHRHDLKIAIEPYRGPFESMAVAMKADIPTAEFFSRLEYGVAFLKLASSAAHLRGLPVAASEAFTGKGNWTKHPGALKYAGDFAFTEGINQLVFHRYAHQPWPDKFPGMTMGRYGFNFERTNTWWEPGKAWVEYITRSQFLLQQGTNVNDILLFAGEIVPNTRPRPKGLQRAGYDYDVCDTGIFAQLKVKDGRIVVPSGRRYRLLMVGPYMKDFLTLETTRKLQDLVRQGGTVLARKPTHTPSLMNFPAAEKTLHAVAEELWKSPADTEEGGQMFSSVTPQEAMEKLGIAPDIVIPANAPQCNWIHRRSDQADIYYVSNQGKNIFQARIGFRVIGKQPELWNPTTGEARDAGGWNVEDNHTYVPISLNTDGSVFVIFRKPAQPEADPFVSVKPDSSLGKETDALVVHSADLIVRGRKNEDHDLKEKIAGQVKANGLFATVAALTEVRRSPFWSHTLDLDYEFKGVRTKQKFDLKDLVAVPERHLLEQSWLTDFVMKDGKSRFRAWHNGPHHLTRASGKSAVAKVEGIPESFTLDAPWDVQFQSRRGAPSRTRFESLISWDQHPDPGIRHFSGTTLMKTQFTLNKDFFSKADEIWLDLGDVRVMARVRLNGKPLGVLWHAPYRLEVHSALKEGENHLEVEVTNLWINRLIGDEEQPDDCNWTEKGAMEGWPQWFKEGKERPSAKRLSFTTWKHWKKGDRLVPSGLRGPLVLRPAKLVDL